MFMSTPPNPPKPETAAEPHVQRMQTQLQVLDRLVAIGLDLTELLQAQAKKEVEAASRLDEPAPDFTFAFERMVRSVRRTILLSDKLAEKMQRPAATQPAVQRVAARKRIIRTVEDSIDRDAPAEAVESLHAEFVERLDSPDFEDDLDMRPVEDIIAEIRRDLGIAASVGTRCWKRRTPKDIALLCARATNPQNATLWPDATRRVIRATPQRRQVATDPPLGFAEDPEPPWHYSPGFHDP